MHQLTGTGLGLSAGRPKWSTGACETQDPSRRCAFHVAQRKAGSMRPFQPCLPWMHQASGPKATKEWSAFVGTPDRTAQRRRRRVVLRSGWSSRVVQGNILGIRCHEVVVMARLEDHQGQQGSSQHAVEWAGRTAVKRRHGRLGRIDGRSMQQDDAKLCKRTITYDALPHTRPAIRIANSPKIDETSTPSAVVLHLVCAQGHPTTHGRSLRRSATALGPDLARLRLGRSSPGHAGFWCRGRCLRGAGQLVCDRIDLLHARLRVAWWLRADLRIDCSANSGSASGTNNGDTCRFRRLGDGRLAAIRPRRAVLWIVPKGAVSVGSASVIAMAHSLEEGFAVLAHLLDRLCL
jgi:hypothetical protein